MPEQVRRAFILIGCLGFFGAVEAADLVFGHVEPTGPIEEMGLEELSAHMLRLVTATSWQMVFVSLSLVFAGIALGFLCRSNALGLILAGLGAVGIGASVVPQPDAASFRLMLDVPVLCLYAALGVLVLFMLRRLFFRRPRRGATRGRRETWEPKRP